MDYRILFKEENEQIRERYDLAMERIELIREEHTVSSKFVDYFQKTANFILLIKNIVRLMEEEKLDKLDLKDLNSINRALYEDILPESYIISYANPTYACEQLGDKYGKLLSFLYTEIRGLIVYAYEFRLQEITIYLELFIEVYNYLEDEDEYTFKDVKRAIYDFMFDYSEILIHHRTRELLDTKLSFAKDIIMNSNLEDLRYLYVYGEYISKNELEIAAYLNKLSEDEIQAMADTFTEGFRRGYENNRLEISKKAFVNLRYRVGFERILRNVILNFEKLGLDVTIYRAAVDAINKKQHLKVGYYGTSPNRQYDYDHRFDIGLVLDKALKEKKLECLKVAMEHFKDIAAQYGGPALIEVFGEELFAPEDKKEAVQLNKRQQKLNVDYYNQENLIRHEYLKLDEISFSIISYPIPEIGEDFEAIFAETVKVNTLDNEQYKRIQQYIIDALDKGSYVHILGDQNNHTDLKVKLYSLTNPDQESVFENCVADVNIPVGEVFTSPVLKGTEGILHVPQVYLDDLEYQELELEFTDGKVTRYTCKNFDKEEKNQKFVKENLLFNHETLPMGEFAIGTNTTAYMMAKKFNIASKLPILIAEKTGPHFALGDTCYKMSEDIKVYNFDGKEIVARDNEISILRKTEPNKAYFNCHTDITLPYHEIKEIRVYQRDGSSVPIIQKGRFVLEGTLELNEPLDN